MLGDDIVNDVDPETCAHCDSSQRGPQIPVGQALAFQERVHFDATGIFPADKWDAPPQYYSRTIDVEVRGVYDGTLFFKCPDCGYAWHRWTDPYMRGRAQKYIDACNAKLEG